ncbi:MAG: HDIG domain-containing protein, partial [Deltaproteobacteria bacterium]|nr:HDIG domain-containing protein [Deltaproteobacteria bacterium]
YLITGVAAGSLVEGTRERISVIRAGVSVGLVGAVAALVMHFVQLFALDGEVSLASTIRPVWSTLFAFTGGVLSSFLVLGLVPLFEAAGFVTDYRLMELANLNHPLLRQLMLRAPGSYHHSVLVGTLAEAGCEAIGANALEAKVAAYFHDVGKGLKPAYFIENQRNNVNRHANLDPWRSAQVIISHVVDGGRMAREHKLPKPIVDNIYMHHGTGLLQYFYDEARRQAAPGETVDIAAFRYPGPRPSTPEAGVILLADKVEAATRTIQHPNEDNIRAMIRRIFDSVLADGQFDECPLTVQQIAVVSETFVTVLLGIHHQRIEYASTADLSRSRPGTDPSSDAFITLDSTDLPETGRVPPEGAWEELPPKDDTSEAVDYESIEHLPGALAGPPAR